MDINQIHRQSLELADKFRNLYRDPTASSKDVDNALNEYRDTRRQLTPESDGRRPGARQAWEHTQGGANFQ